MYAISKTGKEPDSCKAVANDSIRMANRISVIKPSVIQTRLTVGQHGDKYEQEADSVAERVMTMPEPGILQRACCDTNDREIRTKPVFPVITPLIQKQSEEEEEPIQTRPDIQQQDEEEEKPIQTRNDGGNTNKVDASFEKAIKQNKGQGVPLSESSRFFMESRFGADFKDVRVHHDSNAAHLNRKLNSQAFTTGDDIYFSNGKYNQTSSQGRHLLAHELTHVVQQKGSTNNHIHRNSFIQCNFTEPQMTGEKSARTVKVPDKKKDESDSYVKVTRTLNSCPCRRVDKAEKGMFYNDSLDNLAIVYSYCTGGTRMDVYGQLQSNATSFLKGTELPKGTASIGITVNLTGKKVGSKIVLEALGTGEDSEKGVGGKAQVVFQGNKWRVFLDTSFIHKLEQKYQTKDVNDLEVDLGGQFGNVKLRVQLSALLPSKTVTGKGTLCIPLGNDFDLCTVVAGSNKEVRVLLELKKSFDFGPKAEEVKCHTCYCPPAKTMYKCKRYLKPKPDEKVREYRYYYSLDKTEPSEDKNLREQSESNLNDLKEAVKAGGKVTGIEGYASPEAKEREHNVPLSMRRAIKLKDILRNRLASDISLPDPTAGGEILGRLPSSSASSSLGDVKQDNIFYTAEDLSVFLSGKEIDNKDLAGQFKKLFTKLVSPKERLSLFGLTESSPIAKKVLENIDNFMKSKEGSYRPWENVFRLLRVGIGYVKTTKEGSGEDKESHDKISDAECEKYAAENADKFGPVDINAKKPRESSPESSDDCIIKPQPEELKKGCVYDLDEYLKQKKPSASKLAPPAFAPKRL